MAAREILRFPDPKLSLVSRPVVDFDGGLAGLVDDLIDTMREKGPAIGLSAPQLDDQRQVLIIDMTGTGESPDIYVNPVITSTMGYGLTEERCLSVPDAVIYSWRAAKIRVKAHDPEGTAFERELTGMEAVCLQHELDHFEGKTLVDRMSFIRRALYRRRHPALPASSQPTA